MPLEYDELEKVLAEVIEKVRREVYQANATGMLDLVLDKYGVSTDTEISTGGARAGNTVLVLGDTAISKDDLNNLYRRYKVNEKNFEFVEYDDVTNFSFGKLIASNKYSDIFVGPVPHSARDIGSESSVIGFLNDNDDIYAKVTVLRDGNGELKITKRTFREALESSDLLNA